MKPLAPLADIIVPAAKPEQTYRARYFDQDFAFVGLKRLLGAADCSKAGDRNAGLAAATGEKDEVQRAVMLRAILGEIRAKW